MLKMINKNTIIEKYKYIGLLLIPIIFLVFLFIFYKKNSYVLEYIVDNYTVIESYDSNVNKYYISIKKNKEVFNFVSNNKYTNNRRLIEKINSFNNEDLNCISIKSMYLFLPNMCVKNNEYYSPYYNNIANNEEIDHYNNIKIYNNEKNVFIWNYNSFININNNKKEEIKIFNKDLYSLDLVYLHKNDLLIPDYDSEYQFNKLYVINSKNLNKKEFKLKTSIYFDSYFLGDYKNDVYIFDKKNKQEYRLDMKKLEQFRSKYKILENNKWQDVSLVKLQNDELKFTKEIHDYEYFIEDNILFMKNNKNEKIRLYDNISRIVYSNDKEVYFIKDDLLLRINHFNGINLILRNSEWKFNNKNVVFIFD